MRFFIVDNDSQDGTTKFLREQPGCCVFHTTGSYAATRAGLGWLNPLINQYGDGDWIILADADEILVYPHCEQANLTELCAWLDCRGYQGVFALLLDMYSNRSLHAVNYRRGENFLNACNWSSCDYRLSTVFHRDRRRNGAKGDKDVADVQSGDYWLGRSSEPGR